MITVIIVCLLTGAVAGFFSGLFGIGGGTIIVPVMLYIMPLVGVPDAQLMNVALGTTFASIMMTSFASALRHYRLGNVDMAAAKYMIPALVVSIFIAGQFVAYLPKAITSKLFALMVLYLALKMILSIKHAPANKPLTPKSCLIGGSVIGVLSSFAGIAGGSFIVPFLNARGLEMKRAIGTSSTCGIFLSMSAMLSFMISGWNQPMMPGYSIGYVYLPAVILLTLTSFMTTKIGANLASTLPVATLKKAFAVLLLVVVAKILLH
ncbi:sulfite exporter TauE/SafE family protein [Pasteurellaceae bacterium HPA106]|uniref:sulfite exporter TauE/SafE family protein n=1 Tax=Spirabiliibacterium pneumoniae TaxID=221400 RepID=UPI001AAC7A4A|nr:sulfite exporter TauE/SafE family protein [Spirabiliibacterium pneumoniae]MBE2896440.1 sulfite exporter TauE/SafE family protein [Spirabiliibacterium pneumoniae]